MPPASRARTAGPPRDVWGRACHLLILLILFLVPTLYPLRVPDEAITFLRDPAPGWWPSFLSPSLYNAWHWFYMGQLDVFINYGYDPLPLKEGAFSVLVVILLACWYVRQIGRSWSWPGAGSLAFDWRVYGPISALLAWAAISLLWTPTFFYSLKTFAMLAVGVLWFGIVYRMPKDGRTVRRWFNMILLAGAVIAFFASLQDLDQHGWITDWIFPNIEEEARDDPYLLRLRMGSLIGHNIGVGSFLSFSWFILLGRLFSPAAPWKKAARLLYLAFLFWIIMALQTRGIWITLAILTPIHLIWLVRLARPRWDPKIILGGILIVLIVLTLQLIPSPRNPFYSPEAPLLIRFTHFTPSHLKTETRLRIAVCSLPLIAEKPLTGHGLGSFQYVFPEAQARYFTAHPDTMIVPGSRRTMRAHNDWLQLMIELGLPGLLIVLAGLFLLLRKGLAGWSRIEDRTLRFELTAALMGVAGVLIHALGNFPLHVVSDTAPAILLLAVWVGSGRMGRPEGADETPREIQPAGPGKSTRAVSMRLVAILALIALGPAAVGAASWFYAHVHASMYLSVGISYRALYGRDFQEMNFNQRRAVIGQAYATFVQGIKKAPMDRELTFRIGEASVLMGVLAYLQWKETLETEGHSEKLRDRYFTEAAGALQRGIDWLTASQDEVKYHEVFHYIGMAYDHLFRLSNREDHREKAKFNYRMALRYSPAFARSAYHLFELLQFDRPPNDFELRQRCRQIAEYDPALFQRQFVDQAYESIRRRDYAVALAKLDMVLDAQPENPNHWLQKAHVLSFIDQGEQAMRLLEKFEKLFPKVASQSLAGYRMEAALAAGDFEKAIAESLTAEAVSGSEIMAPYYRCVRALALEKLGRPEAAALWAEIDEKAKSDSRYRTSAAETLLYVERDTARAYPYLMLAAESDPPPDAALIRIAAQAAWARNERERAVVLLGRALESDPEDPEALKLLDKWSEDVEGQ